MDLIIAIIIIAALLIGAAAGWFVGAKSSAAWRDRHAEAETRARDLDDRFRAAIGELATMSERAARAGELEQRLLDREERLRDAQAQVAGLRSETVERSNSAETLRSDIANLRASLLESDAARHKAERLVAQQQSGAEEKEQAARLRDKEREEAFAREYGRLAEAEEKLQTKFNEIAEKLLAGAQNRFMERAKTDFDALNKESLAALEKKVAPVGETLDRYRKRMEEIEKNNASGFEQLKGVIGEVRAGQDRVLEGANRIATTLRGATKARGDWGELQLQNLLESCGLYDKADFNAQFSVAGDDGALRPDAIINIPGGRRLVVDVKNVFNTYARANEADTEEERQELLRGHAREVRTHIDALSAKRYQDFVKGSADFVIMFIPGEHVLYAALTQDNNLLDYALKRQVVLASPLNFMSIALTVATVWRQAGVQADATEIAELGKQLYDRLSVVARHISSLRKSLQSTNQHFDALVGSFDTNLRKTGERFEELSIDTTARELHEAAPLNSIPRRLGNFPDPDQDAAELQPGSTASEGEIGEGEISDRQISDRSMSDRSISDGQMPDQPLSRQSTATAS
ncbi:DNA recombination protein RmuC [Croceicoccus sp. F390]|uniref:DNA recombination protein RmuC homolog n=1 Tax=Croceicoccus esteveae TaxID=3075597 RepID=A0ABU2ZG48_9SPHN|nr:DNA recombination protein RmuC [Croceicoccus sp. F390]MDT0575575.1 DNA recombination protein RmuC [Croceicoccus sp. F390]